MELNSISLSFKIKIVVQSETFKLTSQIMGWSLSKNNAVCGGGAFLHMSQNISFQNKNGARSRIKQLLITLGSKITIIVCKRKIYFFSSDIW
jgi:hypothetical protein